MWIRSRRNLINANWVFWVYIDEYCRENDKPIYGLYAESVESVGAKTHLCLETYADIYAARDAKKHICQCLQESVPVCILPKERTADIC